MRSQPRIAPPASDKLGVDDNPFRVKKLFYAETVAGRTGTRRIIEREQARFELREAVATDVAGEAVGEYELFVPALIHPSDAGNAIGKPQGRFEGFGQSLADVFFHFEAIDNCIDTVLLAQIQRRGWSSS